ncbi:MAG: hypothetical protein ACKVRN_10295 [Pyrinomonadaceae bacterium]
MNTKDSIGESSCYLEEIVQGEDEIEYTNYYCHDDCPVNPGIEWEDIWTATCDDECPACRADVSPYKSEIITSNDAEPECGWRDRDIFSVSYEDIEVIIDRQFNGEVEIRVWRKGKQEEVPYALMTFDTDSFVCGHCCRDDVESAECNECEFCIICCTHQVGDSVDEHRRKIITQ